MKLQTKTFSFVASAIVVVFASLSTEARQRSTVDTAIVLAVDNSIAVTAEERGAQINAHVAALRSPAFVDRALSNDRCLGLHYLEWSGNDHAKTILPWTVICSARQAAEAAASIEEAAAIEQTEGHKAAASPAVAIAFAHDAMRAMPFAAKHKIINVSTVYAKEDILSAFDARNRLLQEDYTINAVAFVPDEAGMPDAAKAYLKQYIIAGKDAFAAASPSLNTYPRLLLQSMLLATGERVVRRVPFHSNDPDNL